MSHNSFWLFFRLSVRVLLQGLWLKDTKSAGHWYLVLFSPVGPNNRPSASIKYHSMSEQKSSPEEEHLN